MDGLEELAKNVTPVGDVPGIWRCGVGDAIHAFDRLTHELLKSRRKADRALGERLDEMCQRIVDARMDFAPTDYASASEAGKQLWFRALASKQDTPA